VTRPVPARRPRRHPRLLLAGLILWLLPPAPVRADFEVLWKDLAPYQGRRVTGVELTGRRVTHEQVIRREMRLRVGQPFEIETLLADCQRLENLALFAEIRVGGEAEEPDGVKLTYHLRELPSWIPILAATYTEEDGFSIGPGLSAGNLAGRDITLSAKTFFGGTTQYVADLQWPWIAGNHVSLDFFGARIVRDDTLRGFEETSDEVRPTLGTYLGERGRLAGSFAWFRMRSDTGGQTLSPDNEDTLLRLGASLGWDTRDSWTHPRKGWLNELEVIKTGGFVGGDGDFWTLTADLRRWQRTAARQTLFLGGLVSYQTGTPGEDIPAYMDYRMGGANSIRGYSIEDLGARLYGKSQLIGTAEYSFILMPMRPFKVFKWSLRFGLEAALFADAGIAWSRPGELNLNRTRAGGGGGLRLLIPGVEMVRFDAGWSPEGGFQFHFAGMSKAVRQRLRVR
jgi:outer membrane protein insertion porin family